MARQGPVLGGGAGNPCWRVFEKSEPGHSRSVRVLTSLSIISFLAIAYYIKSDVLRIDFLEHRHLLFFKKPFETPQERAEKQQLFKELLRRSAEGEQIGWVGKSRDGRHIYRDGNMAWAGSIHTVIDLPKGKAVIAIKARGTPAKGRYPYMVVEVDGKEIGSLYVNGIEWKEYAFKVNTNGGRKILSVSYTNDAYVPETGEDRNLYLGDVRVVNQIRSTMAGYCFLFQRFR